VLGAVLLHGEVARRTIHIIYIILSKPLHRHELVLGKFLGLA
jgi:ABC-type transport system involved in multi-copper enzyme maturation permease subunit